MDNSKANLFDYHSVTNQDILISYMGPFDKFIISKLGKKIKLLTADNPQISNKIFKIFIELAQNVSYYSDEKSKLGDEKETGVGSLIIGESEKQYMFATGNSIKSDYLEVLQKKAEIINSLDRESLRRYKIEQRNLVPGSNDGAHIGLIMVALITRKPLEIEFIPINDRQSYFTVTVRVHKDEDEKGEKD